jgi:hypothetical protein
MGKLIACCGLDCSVCDARIATMNNDNELRAQVAEKWRVQYKITEFTAEMVNCTGCREEGVKLGHCSECEVRNCVVYKGFNTCADCDQLKSCSIVGSIHKFVPDALANLKSLNKIRKN